MPKKYSTGFTLVEIMVVVVVIGILTAIVATSYVKSNSTAKKTICVANLKEIDSAIDRWALENHISAGTSISGSEEEIYNGYVRSTRPKCPSTGEYVFGAVGVGPQVTCSKEAEGHKLP